MKKDHLIFTKLVKNLRNRLWTLWKKHSFIVSSSKKKKKKKKKNKKKKKRKEKKKETKKKTQAIRQRRLETSNYNLKHPAISNFTVF